MAEEISGGVAALSAAPAAPAAPTNPDPAAAPAGTPPAAAPAAPSGSAEAKWWASFTDETMRGYAETKNFPSPEEAVRSYSNLEKLLGQKANAVMLPGADAKPEELAAFYDKLGRPAKPDNYPVPDALKEDPVIKAFAAKAHELGLPAKQFEGVMGFVAEQSKALLDAKTGQTQAAQDAELAELKRDNPGLKYDQLLEHGRRAVRSLGIETPDLTKIEGALGTRKMIELLGKIGASNGESPFVEGDAPGGAPSAEAARLQIASYQKDQNFMKSWLAGDADKVALMNKLHIAAAAVKKE
jgi:hypothetical protein